MIEVRSLSSGYSKLPVLRDISFSVGKGETLVFLGRNGVGKTTLLRSLSGNLPLSHGSIVLHGRDIASWPPHRRARSGIAYVPQGRGIFRNLTVEENLKVGLRARRDGATKLPGDVLDLFPILRERMGQLGGTMSGGQQQQLAIARALCGQPDVLLLDEPSEGIQPSIVQMIGQLIKKLNEDAGLTVLLVEQNLELVRQTASRCLIMGKGQISRSLSSQELDDEQLVFAALAN